ncbi:Iron-binding zinc finger CDGSH type [Parendozoicomonas haliclonae]|uniref:Iron-binding zinc finger CDGSH type n=1 Tax=Parendozoicomonas haliclonae TaxID=1960125 RepID=A0A1X7AJ99_9GAMM|nr:Iron-binding zinc finger CDGSH type [Parendozoicomonas haliclonae]
MKMFQKQDCYVITCEADKDYLICQCGQTRCPPFHDLNNCRCEPHRLNYSKKSMQWICGCAKSAEMPFCDGAHNPRNDMGIWDAIKDIFHSAR